MTVLVDSKDSIIKAVARFGSGATGDCPPLVAKQVYGLGGVNMLRYQPQANGKEETSEAGEGKEDESEGEKRGRRRSRDGRDDAAVAAAAAAATTTTTTTTTVAAVNGIAAPATPVAGGGGGGGGGRRTRSRGRSSPRSSRRRLRVEQKGDVQEQEEEEQKQEQELPPALSSFVSQLEAVASPSNPFVIQREVRGREISIFCACNRGDVLAVSVYAPDKSFANEKRAFFLSRSSIEHQAAREWASRVVREIGYTGMIGFDAIEDEVTGEIMPLECNPRATNGLRFFYPKEEAAVVPMPFKLPLPLLLPIRLLLLLLSLLLAWLGKSSLLLSPSISFPSASTKTTASASSPTWSNEAFSNGQDAGNENKTGENAEDGNEESKSEGAAEPGLGDLILAAASGSSLASPSVPLRAADGLVTCTKVAAMFKIPQHGRSILGGASSFPFLSFPFLSAPRSMDRFLSSAANHISHPNYLSDDVHGR